jgi:membrane protein implicated in regulation of membrane protease activity
MLPAMSERPDKKRDDWITRAQARDKWLPLSILAAAVAAYIAREGSLLKYSHGWMDNVLFVALALFVVWLLWPSSKDDDQA